MDCTVDFLYQEQSIKHNSFGTTSELVKVELRKYSYIDGGDYVLAKCVKVDGYTVVDCTQGYSIYAHTNSEMIRLAIKTFDELLANHPMSHQKGGTK